MGLVISFFRRILERKPRILMVGLDGSGKTTILQKLELGKIVNTTRTKGFNVETVNTKDYTFSVWNVGGDDGRYRWTPFFRNTKGLIYVIDSSDGERLPEARSELMYLLHEDELLRVTLLVFATKQDIKGAMSVEEIRTVLELENPNILKFKVRGATVKDAKGLRKGLDWLLEALPK